MAPETIDAVTRTATSSNHNGIGLFSRLIRLVWTALFGGSQLSCYSTFGKDAMYVPERDFEKTLRTLRARTWALLRWLRKNRHLLHLLRLSNGRLRIQFSATSTKPHWGNLQKP